MRFATLRTNGGEQAHVLVHDDRWAPLHLVDEGLVGDISVIVGLAWPRERQEELIRMARRLSGRHLVEEGKANYAPPYRRARKIFGIGLNYVLHASDLNEAAPNEPASFIKGDHTIIGHGDAIHVPPSSNRVTTEAELALIIGRDCSEVPLDEVENVIFGATAVLDQTAEDVLRKNPRFLTRSKNYSTFFSFGPEVVTLDELLADIALEDIRVATEVSGQVRSNRVGNMMHSPRELVSFHSQHMPWFAGDILSTGTPGAIRVHEGDTARAVVDGIRPLVNSVSRGGEQRDSC